ncbi:hypothetical protein [Kitasatospora sp. NPDC005856]|uniref:hypothetical protein n=1 Tax=Kitasatospora sp. NPDC005856 TaxID=3154566 RepID=UPI0033E1BB28
MHAEAGFDGMPGTRHARRLIRDHGGQLADAGRTRRQSAIVTADQALDIATRCDPATAAGARDRLLVALSFNAWTRRSELAALNLADARISSDPEWPGVHVRFRKSKTDQAGRGVEVFLPARRRAVPARGPAHLARPPRRARHHRRAAAAWHRPLGQHSRRDGRRDRERHQPAPGPRRRVRGRRAGRSFTAHDWRSAGRSAARAAGASKEAADRHGRWSPTSNTGDQYERDRGEAADHPMAKVAARQAHRTGEADA